MVRCKFKRLCTIKWPISVLYIQCACWWINSFRFESGRCFRLYWWCRREGLCSESVQSDVGVGDVRTQVESDVCVFGAVTDPGRSYGADDGMCWWFCLELPRRPERCHLRDQGRLELEGGRKLGRCCLVKRRLSGRRRRFRWCHLVQLR